MLMSTLWALAPRIDRLPYVIFLITTLGLIALSAALLFQSRTPFFSSRNVNSIIFSLRRRLMNLLQFFSCMDEYDSMSSSILLSNLFLALRRSFFALTVLPTP